MYYQLTVAFETNFKIFFLVHSILFKIDLLSCHFFLIGNTIWYEIFTNGFIKIFIP